VLSHTPAQCHTSAVWQKLYIPRSYATRVNGLVIFSNVLSIRHCRHVLYNNKLDLGRRVALQTANDVTARVCGWDFFRIRRQNLLAIFCPFLPFTFLIGWNFLQCLDFRDSAPRINFHINDTTARWKGTLMLRAVSFESHINSGIIFVFPAFGSIWTRSREARQNN
jgi:hypothetical protein